MTTKVNSTLRTGAPVVERGLTAREKWTNFQQKMAPYLFVSPFLILFLCFGLYPIFRSLQLSLFYTDGPKDTVFIGLGNYAFLFKDPDFWTAVKNTLTFAVFSVGLQIPMALGLAILLTQPWLKGREGWRLAIFSPNLMGSVFTGVLFTVLFLPQYGLFNKGLHWVTNGAIPLDTKWLSEPSLVMPAIIITSLWMSTGFNMIYFLAALQSVDKDLYEAATVDGANDWQQFWAVTMPGIRPVTTFVLVTSTIGSFQLFELPYNLLGSSAGPKNAGLTVVMYLYQNGFVTGDLGYASAVGWTLAFAVLVISLIQMRLTGTFKKAGD